MIRLLAPFVTCGLLWLGAFAPSAPAAQIFSVDCELSHRSFDDPIVTPGQPHAAHSHEFTGAWSTDAFSTPESLMRSGTSCLTNDADKPSADRSAYWSPTLFQNGRPVALKGMALYVNLGTKNNAGQIAALKSFPPGLKMIADIRNSYRYEAGGWGCGGTDNKDYGITPGPEIQPCPHELQNGVVFPDCWDGVHLDSADHRSHVAYALINGDCPSTHPVYLPSLFVKHIYDSKGEGGGYTVAEGTGGESGWTGNFHSDFMNGWDQNELDHLVQYCIKQGNAVSNTRPCLGPQLSVSETEAAERLRTNPNSPEPTPAGTTDPAPPGGDAPASPIGHVWSYGTATVTAILGQVPIPDVLGSDTTYSMRTVYTGPGTVNGDSVVMMLGNTARDQARILVNQTKAKAQIIVAGVAATLTSVRFTPDVPHDYVLVRDGGVARFYMDGTLVAFTALRSSAAHDLGPGALGAYRDGERYYARAVGAYDGARVYAYALSAEEAATRTETVVQTATGALAPVGQTTVSTRAVGVNPLHCPLISSSANAAQRVRDGDGRQPQRVASRRRDAAADAAHGARSTSTTRGAA